MRISLSLPLFFFLSSAVATFAQEDPRVVQQPDRRSLSLVPGESISLQFENAFNNILIADPTVADVDIIDGMNFILRAKKGGFTSITLRDDKGTVAVRDLTVALSLPPAPRSVPPHHVRVRVVEVPLPSIRMNDRVTAVEHQSARITSENYVCPGNGSFGCVLNSSVTTSTQTNTRSTDANSNTR